MKAITIIGKWEESLLKDQNLKGFQGKKVIVTVIELEDSPKTSPKEWTLLGSANLGGRLDEENIRDFAHE